MAASRGVIRADDPAELVSAFARVAAIVKGAGRSELLVEDYMPGGEVAVEGLLDAGRLRVLAIFDKPDPLTGPYFEETLYVTPSRLTREVQARIAVEFDRGCRALGLTEGPVHGELRVHDGLPWMLEIAPRTIGGLCSRTLRFGAGISLEELVLRHALGVPTPNWEQDARAAGVMMMPIPRPGRLRRVHGLARARAVPLVEGVTISLHRGAEVVPLPEGRAYLGFIFARGESPAAVEAALREAHAALEFEIES
jgi:biotin carboxylase